MDDKHEDEDGTIPAEWSDSVTSTLPGSNKRAANSPGDLAARHVGYVLHPGNGGGVFVP